MTFTEGLKSKYAGKHDGYFRIFSARNCSLMPKVVHNFWRYNRIQQPENEVHNVIRSQVSEMFNTNIINVVGKPKQALCANNNARKHNNLPEKNLRNTLLDFSDKCRGLIVCSSIK